MAKIGFGHADTKEKPNANVMDHGWFDFYHFLKTDFL